MLGDEDKHVRVHAVKLMRTFNLAVSHKRVTSLGRCVDLSSRVRVGDGRPEFSDAHGGRPPASGMSPAILATLP
jgi:hypothetical protein